MTARPQCKPTTAERLLAKRKSETTAQLRRETAQRRFTLLPRGGGKMSNPPKDRT